MKHIDFFPQPFLMNKLHVAYEGTVQLIRADTNVEGQSIFVSVACSRLAKIGF
jgi:hypothetical protein